LTGAGAGLFPLTINKLPIDWRHARWFGAAASCLRGETSQCAQLGAVKTAGAQSGEDLSLQALLKLSHGIDAFTRWTGKRLAWLILVAVLISAANAIVRKAFDTSSNSWLELQWVLFSIVFLLCSSWTLLDNEHIRIDIVNNALPKTARNIIDLIGHLFFLIPLTVVMIVTGVPFFLRSLQINEQSGNAGGLPQWPAKSLIMIGFAFLLVQGISEVIKRIAIMRGMIPDPHESQVSALEAEVEHLVEAIEKK
jgi:TRAP-type mannitol/chloroaromatic compound transport system permease small subunit